MQNHSTKKAAQQLAYLLKVAGIKDIVISPGSRNAPLIIEFTQQNFFNNYSIVDERAAGFFALGMAQQTQKPVVLVCTSGSAVLNYHPAVAEAFYSKIPLIVVSADRPQKWIDHGEGQTIRQHNVLSNHTWYNVTLSGNNEADSMKTAIETAIFKQGPVHINMPFDEPLYNTTTDYDPIPLSIDAKQTDTIYDDVFLDEFADKWNKSLKKMILVGQHKPSKFLQLQLEKLAQDSSVIILNENISNVQHHQFINNIDQAIFGLKDGQLEMLQPDILISVGRNIVSKKVKQFLRKYKPKQHWHIEKTSLPPNTFEALSQHFDTSPEMFFSQFLFIAKPTNNVDYQQDWLHLKNKNKNLHQSYISKIDFSDFQIFDILSKLVPNNYKIQWGNSSTIRYAQLVDFNPAIQHYSNRGTSGIDGSTATSIGAAYVSDNPTLLVTGDISFLYDSNGLWNKYIPKNYKILIINNGGGDIFNFIPGPSKTEALEEFFVTKHVFKAKHLAKLFGFTYNFADNRSDFKSMLIDFFKDNSKPQILEVDTSIVKNHKILKDYFSFLFKTS